MGMTDAIRDAKTDAKPHLSHTQMDMYWRCPEQYRRRYIEGETLPPGIALIEGKAVHAGAELNFKQKVDTRKDMPANEVIEAAVADFEKQVAGGYALNDEEMGRGPGIVLGEAKDSTARLAELHATEQAPDYQPVAVEHVTRIVLPKATHDLLTVTDLIDDLGRVIDIKTAKRSMPAAAVHGSTQLTIYAVARQIDTGSLPPEVRLDVLVKTKVPKRQLLMSTRTATDIQVLANRINVTLDAINKGSFPPCGTGSWCCSSRWCGYWSTCPYVNTERRDAAEGE